MNEAHFHLAINHLPIVFPLAGIVVMLVGLLGRSPAVVRAAYLIFVLAAFSAVAAMVSGERAEHMVEKINEISGEYVEKHEETAKIFAAFCYLLGAFSILGLWASFKKKAFSGALSIFVLLFAAVTVFFAQQTGTTGGEIRHTEIRQSGGLPVKGSSPSEAEHED